MGGLEEFFSCKMEFYFLQQNCNNLELCKEKFKKFLNDIYYKGVYQKWKY